MQMGTNKKDVIPMIPMKCITTSIDDIYFNLATEEYLIKQTSGSYFFLWQSSPCVVIGKHQNINTEVDLDYIYKNGIKPARRFSGGGTVYQDNGNINLTFIEEVDKSEEAVQPDFDKYPKLMSDILKITGIEVEINQRRSLFIKGDKISGSAQYIHKNKHLYHATLLFSSNLNKLSKAVRLNENFEIKQNNHKYIASVKSPVTNIINHLSSQIDLIQFKKNIYESIKNKPGNSEYTLSQSDIDKIEMLKNNKYERKEWIFGK